MNIAVTLVLWFLCSFNVASATDSPFATIATLETETVASESGELFIDVDDEWHPMSAIEVDDNGFCYLLMGRKHKQNDSFSDSEAELACLLQCPDCGRVQTCSVASKNKGHCSRCWEMLPVSALSWKCTNCGTQNYLNPDKCGWPSCGCPRHLCDPDVKNNRNSTL